MRRETHSNVRLPSFGWIRTLAAPYLQGYRAVSVRDNALRGFRFLARNGTSARGRRGFFVGYLLDPAGDYEFLRPAPPECIVFTFIEPVGGALYRRLVASERSLLRTTAEYISWLTHRPPRFAFFDDRPSVLVRHFSMREWPWEDHEHFSRNFFIETLAWLVRSGLVKRLASAQIWRREISGRTENKT